VLDASFWRSSSLIVTIIVESKEASQLEAGSLQLRKRA